MKEGGKVEEDMVVECCHDTDVVETLGIALEVFYGVGIGMEDEVAAQHGL